MSAGSVSIARYSRFADGDDVLRFIVMIHAAAPSMITVFSCVYVNALDDHTTEIPALWSCVYAGMLNDFVVDDPSRMTWTSTPDCLRATSDASIGDESI